MKQDNHNSRRSFLSTIAILSAGAALSQPARLFSIPAATGLKTEWEHFCRQHGAQEAKAVQALQQETPAVSGSHTYKEGPAVYFPGEKVWAQPVWIFWKERPATAADLSIHFFENGTDKKRLGAINRFELKGLNLLTQQLQQTEGSDKRSALSLYLQKSVKIKARVKSGNELRLSVAHPEKQFSVEKYFYNI